MSAKTLLLDTLPKQIEASTNGSSMDNIYEVLQQHMHGLMASPIDES